MNICLFLFILLPVYSPLMVFELNILMACNFVWSGFQITLGFKNNVIKRFNYFIQESSWKWRPKDYKSITYLKRKKHKKDTFTITNDMSEKELYIE